MRFVAELPNVHLEDFDAFFRATWRTLAVEHSVLSEDGKMVSLYPGAWAELQVIDFESTGRLYAPTLNGHNLMSVAVAHYSRANLFIDVMEEGQEDFFFFPNVVQWLGNKFNAHQITPRIEAPLAFEIWKANGFPTPHKDLLAELNRPRSVIANEVSIEVAVSPNDRYWIDIIVQARASGNVSQYLKERNKPRSSFYKEENRLKNHPLLNRVSTKNK